MLAECQTLNNTIKLCTCKASLGGILYTCIGISRYKCVYHVFEVLFIPPVYNQLYYSKINAFDNVFDLF